MTDADGDSGPSDQRPVGASGATDGTASAGYLQRFIPSVISRNYVAKFTLSLIVVVALLSAVGVVSYVQIQDHVENEASAELTTSAKLHADSVSTWRTDIESQTASVASSPMFEQASTREIRQFLRDILAVETSRVAAIHYVETSGETHSVVASTESILEGSSASEVEPAWVQPLRAVEGIDNGPRSGTVTSDTYQRGSQTLVAFVSPVAGADGAVVIVSPVADTREQFSEQPQSFSTHIVDASGTSVFVNDPDSATLETDQQAVDDALAGQSTTVETDERLAAYAPVNGTSWVVITSAEKRVLFATNRRIRQSYIVFVGTAIVSLAGVGLILGRHTITPLVELRRRTQAMESGDLNVDLSTTRTDEIGRLYDSFANMRDALRSQIREAHQAREAAEKSTRELERQNERLDEFASTLSHDLRNPLTVARGHVELLSTRLSSVETNGEDFQNHITKLESAHDRIESIIDDVLTLTRRGASVEETAPMSLDTIAIEAWNNIDNRDATLEIEESRTIDADRSRLLRALENLFRNAIDHVGDDVTVRIGVTDDGFYVADDGPGIPTEEVDDIFDYGHTTSDEGTGLGLSIVKTVADAHGWRLYVDTTYLDGAMFVFADVFDADEPDWYATDFEWVGMGTNDD